MAILQKEVYGGFMMNLAKGIDQPFIPILESGDRLNRVEFERRYRQLPQVKKAELVEGVVYMSSPVRIKHHAEPHADIILWLGTYKVATPGVMLGDNATVRLDLENEPQPDGFAASRRVVRRTVADQ